MDENQTVLVVDEDPDVLREISETLSKEGYEVVTARIWTEAIAGIQEKTPDLVLLDLYLSTVRGEALLQFIRELDEHLPVVIISTEFDEEHLGRLGARGFVRKPFEEDDLILVIEQVLAERGSPPLEHAPASPSTLESEAGSAPEVPPSPSRQAPSPPPPLAVLPGAGAETLERRRQTGITRPPPGRRRRTGRRRGSFVKHIRNFALAFVLCVLIGLMVWVVRQTFSAGFFGISISTTETE